MKAVNNILKNLKDFEGEKGFFTGDKVKDKYFKAHVGNADVEDITLKISAIETDELRQIVPDLRNLSSYIAKAGIDEGLVNGDPAVVNKLMEFYQGGERVTFMTFCSAYSCWHNKDAYPVFNLEAIRILSKYYKRTFSEYLDDYTVFQQDMVKLREKLGLEELNFQELEKFFWLFANELEKTEVKPETA